MKEIFEILSGYNVLAFADAIKINLNERYDQKFLLPIHLVLPIFENLQSDFFVQEGAEHFFQPYKTKYWDSLSFDFYSNHAKGRGKRLKVRKRLYTNTNTAFLEIKKKEHNKTLKHRIKASYSNDFSNNEISFLKKEGINHHHLLPVLEVDYNRITLWDKEKDGRITLDFNFSPSKGSENHQFNNVVIIEIKGSIAFINRMIRRMPFPINRYSTSFSKYGIGMIFCHNFPKQRYKNFLLVHKHLQKLNSNLC